MWQVAIKLIFLISTILLQDVASQICYHNTSGSDQGFIQCPEPAQNTNGIFVTRGNLPVLKKNLFAPFTNVASISIFRSNIQKIEPGTFDGLNIKVIKLGVNSIANIEYGTFNSLNRTTMLEVDQNQLEFIGPNIFLGMTSLSWISLSGNKIRKVDKAAFNGLENLTFLHMTSNKIKSFELGTFDSLTSLEYLGLTRNSLKDLQFGLFAYQRRLQKLALDLNQLESLPDYLFANVTALQEINVSGNKLRKLQKNLFYGIENLKKLKFYANNVNEFNTQEILPQLPKLEEVELYENPWTCEDLKKIRNEFEERKIVSSIPVLVENSPNVNGIGCNQK